MIFFIGGLELAVFGCATPVSVPPPLSAQNLPPQTKAPDWTLEGLNPSAIASLQLTEQGRMLLENGHPDDAIAMLERAINLNPANGQIYYYLSEAWLFKGKFVEAKEFNSLAEIYLKESNGWTERLMEQRKRIANNAPERPQIPIPKVPKTS